MCLIIASQTGVLPPDEVLRYAHNQNHDGWGIMYFDGSTVQVVKGMKSKALVKATRRIAGLPYVIHLRWATHGAVNLDNTHPFKIRDGLYMAHNGVLKIDTPNKKFSDTWHYAQDLAAGLAVCPEWYDDAEFIAAQSKEIGKSNKLAFLNDKGEIKLVNEDQGDWHEGMWFSNTYSLPWHYTDKFYATDTDDFDDEHCSFCWEVLDEYSMDGLCLNCNIEDAEYIGDKELAEELRELRDERDAVRRSEQEFVHCRIPSRRTTTKKPFDHTLSSEDKFWSEYLTHKYGTTSHDDDDTGTAEFGAALAATMNNYPD